MFQKGRIKKNIFIVLGFLFFLNFLAWIVVYDLNRVRYLKVVFFDVGQGDAIFIETPRRQQILIDGGPNSAILEKLAKEIPFYDRTLDLIILTHPEKDHLTGLLEILKRYKIDNILWTGVIRDTSEWKEWKELIEKENAQIKTAKSGQKIILDGENHPVFLDILYPLQNLKNKEFKDSNETSIVSHLVFGENSFLFTGDIGEKDEDKLVDENIDSEVLKIAHHGSKNSTSEKFLRKVLPEIAVIQVGKNSYGHPTSEVLAKLSQFGIQVLRTDQGGDIKIVSDGKLFKIFNQK